MDTLVTVFALGFKISNFPGFSEDEVSQSCPKANSKEQPAIVSHGYQHEDVCHAHLHHMKPGLQDVQRRAVHLE